MRLRAGQRPIRGPPVFIFDCNGVLVDSESIVAERGRAWN